jgi:drug/metabolite transporter (DMT)-like permease
MYKLLPFLCVIGIAIGQILFKLTAVSINKAGTAIALPPALLFFAACSIYAITSVGWVYVLRSEELSKAYPTMALSFVIVPLLSHFFFGEKFTPLFLFGTVCIVMGIGVVLVSPSRL